MGSTSRRELWGGTSQKGLFSKRALLPQPAGDETSATEPASPGSSAFLDFDLPNWERPQDVVAVNKYDTLPTPMLKPPSGGIGGYRTLAVSPAIIPHSPPRKAKPRVQPAPEPELANELTNMEIMCDHSFDNSIGDISMDDEGLGKGPKRQQRRSHVQDDAAGQKAPDEEAFRLNVEKSKQDAASMYGNVSTGMSSSLQAPGSPGGAPAKNFIWKKGPNGRYMKVPIGVAVVPGKAQQQRLPVASRQKEEQEKRLEEMEEQWVKEAIELSMREEDPSVVRMGSLHGSMASLHSSFQAPRTLHSSMPSQGSCSITLQSSMASRNEEGSSLLGAGNLHGSTVSLQSSFHGSRHLHSSMPSHGSCSMQAELEGQEEELIRMAMERSLRDVTASEDPLAGGSSHTAHTAQRNNVSPTRKNTTSVDRRALYSASHARRRGEMPKASTSARQNRVVRLGDGASQSPPVKPAPVLAGFLHTTGRAPTMGTAASSSIGVGESFVWKKGPHNRYVKCPIPMDQLDEECAVETFPEQNGSSDQGGAPEGESLAHSCQMEERLLQEAMERSMRDMYAGH